MFKKSFAGGLCIGIAALANMLAPHPVIGAFLFCFGLFVILANDFKLCTGIFGNCKTTQEWSEALEVYCGNWLGALTLALLVLISKWDIPKTTVYDAHFVLVFLKSVLCGIMIHLGVTSYKNGHHFVMLLSVMTFVLCGMEHCVANTFLALFADEQETFLLPYTFNILGNVVGAKIINYFMENELNE